jgi:hypothetical protein
MCLSPLAWRHTAFTESHSTVKLTRHALQRPVSSSFDSQPQNSSFRCHSSVKGPSSSYFFPLSLEGNENCSYFRTKHISGIKTALLYQSQRSPSGQWSLYHWCNSKTAMEIDLRQLLLLKEATKHEDVWKVIPIIWKTAAAKISGGSASSSLLFSYINFLLVVVGY